MSISRVQVSLVSLVVCASLAAVAGTALGQATPAPQPDSAAPVPAAPPVPATPPDPAAPPAPVVPPDSTAPTAAPVPPAASALDPDLVKAAVAARAAGTVLEVTKADTVSGCRDLGEAHADTQLAGASGRLEIRTALRQIGQARGASHVLYTGSDVLASSHTRWRGHFYDCTVPDVPMPGAAPGGRRPSTAFSAQLELLPVGSLLVDASAPAQPVEADVVTAYGISGILEYIVAPDAAIGVNPGVVLGLKADGAKVSATEFDVRARLRLGRLSNDGFGAHAYASAGASWIVFPGETPTSFGAILGFGIAVSHPVERAAFITVEVGYQLGFQSATVGDEDVEVSSRLFHIALGIGSYL